MFYCVCIAITSRCMRSQDYTELKWRMRERDEKKCTHFECEQNDWNWAEIVQMRTLQRNERSHIILFLSLVRNLCACVILSDNFRRFLHTSVCAVCCAFGTLCTFIATLSAYLPFFIHSKNVVGPFFSLLLLLFVWPYIFGRNSSTSFVCD